MDSAAEEYFGLDFDPAWVPPAPPSRPAPPASFAPAPPDAYARAPDPEAVRRLIAEARAGQHASVTAPTPNAPRPLVACPRHGAAVPAFFGGRERPTRAFPAGSCWFCAIAAHKVLVGGRGR